MFKRIFFLLPQSFEIDFDRIGTAQKLRISDTFCKSQENACDMIESYLFFACKMMTHHMWGYVIIEFSCIDNQSLQFLLKSQRMSKNVES